MQLFTPVEKSSVQALPLIDFQIPAGFPSPATDYVETRIDLSNLLVSNPSFTFLAYAEGESMYPEIQNGDLMVIDRKVDQPNGCIVLASVNNAFCVKQLFRWPDGSLELRSLNVRFESIHLPDDYEGDFEIFGRVIWTCRNLQK